MTDSARTSTFLPDNCGADRTRALRDFDDGVMAEILQNGGLAPDLSLERWLDRIVFRGDRA